MKTLITCSVLIIMTLISSGLLKQNENPEDIKLVKEAILDYVEGVYEADTLRIYRSVHPGLVKRGASFNKDRSEYSEFRDMNFQQLVQLTKTWNKEGNRANSKSVKDIEIYDVQDKTASAKVTAVWGTDYFHLAKIDGKWLIMNVLWQSQRPLK